MYDVDNDGYSTEFSVVYTRGGSLLMENCDISILAKPNISKTGPAYISTNASNLNGDLTITTSSNNLPKNSDVGMSDVYITNLNGKTVTINGTSVTKAGSNSFFSDD